MAQETDKILIRKFMAGNCTPQERERMKKLMQHPDSNKLFDQVMDEDWHGFMKQEPLTDDYIFNLQERLNARLDRGPAMPVPVGRSINIYRYAAILAIMILGASTYGVWQLTKKTAGPVATAMLSSYSPNGQRSTITLSDSSVITLGAGSRINYPERFMGDTREVSLEGEAFFEITKNPKKPFIVHTGEVQTKVLGTSFKIDAFKGKEIVVAVATGKVKVDRKMAGSGKMKSLAILLPGHTVSWNPVSGLTTTGNRPADELTEWKKGRLVFTGTPLGEVIKTLEHWYNVKIELHNRQIGNYKMNITLDGMQPLNQSLEILRVTTKAHYTIKDKTIIFQ